MHIDCRIAFMCACVLALCSAAFASPVDTVRSRQVIEWDADVFAGGYRLEILDQAGDTVLDDTGDSARREIHLDPGSYRYRITVFNLLGKPETVGSWHSIVVKKAERPDIVSFSPQSSFIGDADMTISIRGKNISAETEFYLLDPASRKLVCRMHVIGISSDDTLSVSIPSEFAQGGSYIIHARNPGGLESDSRDRFRVERKKDRSPSPFSVSIAAGWVGYVPVSDDWYTGVWNDGLYPAGACSNLDFEIRAASSSSFGLRASAAYCRPDENSAGIPISTDMRMFSGTVFFRRFFTPLLSAAFGVGGGSTFTYIKMDSDASGSSGSIDVAAISPSLDAFVELRYAPVKRVSLSIAVSATDTMVSSRHFVALVPELSAGWVF